MQEELPPNVLWRIVNLVGPKELKSLHRVNRAWRDAVCQGLDTVVVKKGNFHLLPRFPNVNFPSSVLPLTSSQPALECRASHDKNDTVLCSIFVPKLTSILQVKSLGLQGAFLKQAETPMLESLQSIVLRDCSFEGSLASLVSLKVFTARH